MARWSSSWSSRVESLSTDWDQRALNQSASIRTLFKARGRGGLVASRAQIMEIGIRARFSRTTAARTRFSERIDVFESELKVLQSRCWMTDVPQTA